MGERRTFMEPPLCIPTRYSDRDGALDQSKKMIVGLYQVFALDGRLQRSLPYSVRRTSLGTINTGTNPGKSPSGLRKKPQPPPMDPVDNMDDATQLDGPRGMMPKSSLEDELFNVPDFNPGMANDPEAPTVIRAGGAIANKKPATASERRQ